MLRTLCSLHPRVSVLCFPAADRDCSVWNTVSTKAKRELEHAQVIVG